jgi:hypothetical protein
LITAAEDAYQQLIAQQVDYAERALITHIVDYAERALITHIAARTTVWHNPTHR